MTLHHDWRAILKHAWSVKLIIASGVLSALEVVIPIFSDSPPIPRGLFALLAFTVTLTAAGARLLAQKQLCGVDK